MKIEIGDHLVSPRCGYTHHGIYIGDGNVIHYGGYAKTKSHGVIVIASLQEFSDSNPVRIRFHGSRMYSHEESVQRAYTRLGEDWYNVLLNNCEHFVYWCIFGLPVSRQANNLILCALACTVLAKKAAREKVTEIIAPTIIDTVLHGRRIADEAGIALEVTKARVIYAGAASGLTGLTNGLVGVAASGMSLGAVAIVVPFASIATSVALTCLVGYGVSKLFD